jgi:hypothetical protein
MSAAEPIDRSLAPTAVGAGDAVEQRIPWSRRAWLRVATVIALLAFVEFALLRIVLIDPARNSLWIGSNLVEFALWVVMTPSIIALTRRFPVNLSAGSWRSLILHLLFSLICAVLVSSVCTLYYIATMHAEVMRATNGNLWHFFGQTLASFLMIEAMVYWSIIALSQWWSAEHRRNRAVADAATARMQAIRQSLAPHFTLNALNALVAMLPESSREQRFAIAIGGFMHDLFAARHRTVHSLKEECAMIERYLSIEQIRLGERLDATVEIDPALHDLPVPALALQPVIENAVRHAVAPFRGGGRLRLSAANEGNETVLRIESAASEPFRPMPGFGYGEDSTRSRFEQMYDTRLWFRSVRLGGNRYLVTITIAPET